MPSISRWPRGSAPSPRPSTRCASAPEAFRAVQFRAVTERDWEEMALRHPDVAAAKASFRWTGSWHTVFVAIHPIDEANLVRLPGGGAELATDFAAAMKAHLVPFKLAGYDLVVRAAIYVPLEIEIELCVARGHFRGDVLEAVTARSPNAASPTVPSVSSIRWHSSSASRSISRTSTPRSTAVEGVEFGEGSAVQALLGSCRATSWSAA